MLLDITHLIMFCSWYCEKFRSRMIFTCDSQHRQVLVVKAHQHIACEGGHNRVIMLHNYPPVKWNEQESGNFSFCYCCLKSLPLKSCGCCYFQHRQMLVLKTHHHITCEGIHKSSSPKYLLLLVQIINIQVNILLLLMLHSQHTLLVKGIHKSSCLKSLLLSISTNLCGCCKSQHRQVLVLKTHQHITCEGIHKSSYLKCLLLLVQRINMQVNILLLRMLQFPALALKANQHITC